MTAALVVAALATASARRCDEETLRTDVNFATGGSTTGIESVNDAFALAQPELGLGGLLEVLRAAGLDVYGMDRQVDFLTQTMNDVDEETDLFWVQGGTNSYLLDILAQRGFDASRSPREIRQVLERLYTEAGARRFVVPNLIPLGDAPIYANFPPSPQIPDWKAFMNFFTGQHNQALAGEVSAFLLAHDDAEVVSVDAAGAYAQFVADNPALNTDLGCNTPGLGLDLAAPGACDSFLYLDFLHPTTAAWAGAAVNATSAVNAQFGVGAIERVVTVGDSFSDVGAYVEAIGRALQLPFEAAAGILSPAPATEGRFTDGKNIVQMVEEGLEIATPATYFQQPKVSPFALEREEGKRGKLVSTFDLSNEVYVPKFLQGEGHGNVVVKFHAEEEKHPVVCRYRKRWNAYTGSNFDLRYCSKGVQGGDKIAVESVSVLARRNVNSVSHDFLYL